MTTDHDHATSAPHSRHFRAWIIAGVVLILLATTFGFVLGRSSDTSATRGVAVELAVRASLPSIPSDLYQVHVTSPDSLKDWALFRETATTKGLALFQNTYGLAHRHAGKWILVVWGTGLVACSPQPGNGGVMVTNEVRTVFHLPCP
ncbi:MAG: hypothetical protein WCG86_06085 [Actinomycetota bacterium]